jgi:hypothetical protein
MSSTTAPAVLAEARRHIGVKEVPDGSNKTPFGKQYGTNGVAWCAIFTSCVFENLTALDLIFGKNAYTPVYAKRFYDRGQWGMVPKPGALVFFAWGTGTGRWKGIQHVGIVESVEAGGTFITIEGNVGNRVQRLRRSMRYVAGFAYPAYAAAAVPVPAKPVRPMPLLRRGSTGGAVRTLQAALNKTFPGLLAVDGIFGPRTDAAVRSYQRKKGLVVDGIVGPRTWKALGYR